MPRERAYYARVQRDGLWYRRCSECHVFNDAHARICRGTYLRGEGHRTGCGRALVKRPKARKDRSLTARKRHAGNMFWQAYDEMQRATAKMARWRRRMIQLARQPDDVAPRGVARAIRLPRDDQ